MIENTPPVSEIPLPVVKTQSTTTTVESVVDTTGDIPMDESSILGISIRSWLAIMFSFTICIMSFMNKEIIEPLYGLGYIAIGFFFGKASHNLTKK